MATIEIKIDSSNLADAKERLFGDLSSGTTGGTSGGQALASGCAALLIALYGLQSEIALSSAQAAQYKSQLADSLQAKLDGVLAKKDPLRTTLDNKEASTEDKEKAQRDLDKIQQDYLNEQGKGQIEQEKVSMSSNVLQGYMSQQSQGMQAFIKLIEALNPSFLSNLLARG